VFKGLIIGSLHTTLVQNIRFSKFKNLIKLLTALAINTMSPQSFEWGGRNKLHSIWAIMLVFTFQIRFIILETKVEVDDSKAALLRELSGAHLFISAYPVSSLAAVL